MDAGCTGYAAPASVLVLGLPFASSVCSLSLCSIALARSTCSICQSMRIPRSAHTITPTDWFARLVYLGLIVSGGLSL